MNSSVGGMMKTRLIACLSLAAVVTAGLSISFSHTSKEAEKASASSYSTNTVPTTIDLNDASASTIRNYYGDLSNLATNERQGTNLLKNLKPILKNGQKYYSYGKNATTAVWQIYEIVDRDWNKSPASAINGYNSTTNKITGYVYGESNSKVGTNPYVHALYVNRNVTNQTRAWGNHEQNQWGINQEHIWAKSCGFDDESPSTGARGDIMHLWAGNGKVNNMHSNYYYGYVDKTKTYTDAKKYATTLSGNYKGFSKTLGGTYTVFEPQDSDKGDIARALFYMAARYNYLSGSDSDGIDSGNPNLEIINQLNWAPGTSYTSSKTDKGQMGILQDLLEWNRLDPPDEWEIHRNNLLYNNYTNNRNPFIDYPEWAEFIWGKSVDGSYSFTSTGYATPSSDTINDFAPEGDPVSVTGVTITPTSATVAVDGTIQLTPTVSPSNATNKNVTWTTSNSSVATVSNGVVTGKSAGTATITVKTVDGNKTATCSITVKSLSSISIAGQTTEFDRGDEFVFGGTVTANYSDGTHDDVTSISSYSGYSMNVLGTHTVTVSYANKTATYEINIIAGSSTTTIASVSIATYADDHSWANGTKYGTVQIDSNVTATATGGGNTGKYYTSGEEWRYYQSESAEITISVPSGYELDSVTFSYNVSNSGILKDSSNNTVNSGSEVSVSGSSVTFSVGNSGTATNGQVKFTSISVTYHNTSTGPSLTDISLDTTEVQTEFEINDEFNYNDLVVTAIYSDSTSEVVDPTSVSTPDMSTSGEKTVTVTFLDKEATYTITVISTPTSISASIKNNKVFYVGETITIDDIIVTTNLGDDVTASASFSSYTFTYADAASGGTITDKTFTDGVTYSTFSCNLTARVQRKARVDAGTVTDTLTRDLIGITGTSYTSWNNKTDESDAVYAGQSAGKNTVDSKIIESIQIRSNNSNSGIISTSSGGKLKSVVITFNSNTAAGRTINVYGKNVAYSSPTDLYSDESDTRGTSLGTIVKGTSTTLSISGDYTYIGLRSASGAIYIDEIKITYGSDDYAENLANYIMYEDTNNQCDTKTDIAIGYFEGLSTEERTTFMTSNSYVISTARERLNAWLRNQGKIISNSYDDYVVQANKTVLSMIINSNNMTTVIAVILSSLGVMSIGGYFLFRKKKED